MIIRLLNAMKGMKTANVGMRESRKEMRRAVPADRLLVLLSLVSNWEATMAKAGVAAADIKSFSVSAEVMAPGLERTVMVWSSWVLVTVSSVTAI